MPQKQKRVIQRTTFRNSNTSVLSFASGSKTKTLTGKGVIDRARREAKELSFFGAKKSVLAIPTHKLQNQASTIRRAPQGLIDEHRRPGPSTDDKVQPVTIRAPKSPSITAATTLPSKRTFEEKERRLKVLTSPDCIDTHSSPASSRSQITMVLSTAPDARSTSSRPTVAYTVPKMKAPNPNSLRNHPPSRTKRANDDPLMPAKRRRIA